ncbi:hypothetical protein [Litorisediminicola beolgyonensis]|uniref:Uncharacterized protein n=1 Tax=Litorisediminicola beolgyonensis TaxID=1173614 RepID=A0ABW3ZMG7_9RHOB
MKPIALSLLLLSTAAPAMAHVETLPHSHGADAPLWGAALLVAALAGIGLAVLRRA